MKRLSVLLLLFWFFEAPAQINELGVFLGGSSYMREIGSTQYLRPNNLAIGAVYKWNRSARHSFRFSIKHAEISGDDADADSDGRVLRGLSFENRITEITAGLEFNFFEFDLHELDMQFTPYVYTGISYAFFNETHFESGEQVEDGNAGTLAIPMAVGIKTNITPKLILGVEAGFRYALNDNLDGSNPKDSSLEPFRFGNINSNDWYVFTGLTLTYTFTEKPCFCSE